MRYHDSRWGVVALVVIGVVTVLASTVGGRGEQPGRASEASATATVLPARTPRPPSVGQGSVTPAGVSGETAMPAITATLDEAGEAQMDEQPPCKREGEGSIPSASSTPTACISRTNDFRSEALVQTPLATEAATEIPAPKLKQAPPVAVTTPVPARGSLDAWIAASNWPSHLWGRLKAVVMCESRGQTTARNGPHVGLLQVNERFHGPVPAGPVAQLNDGYEVYIKQGWGAWACS